MYVSSWAVKVNRVEEDIGAGFNIDSTDIRVLRHCVIEVYDIWCCVSGVTLEDEVTASTCKLEKYAHISPHRR